MTRAERRQYMQRAKERVRRKFLEWGEIPTVKQVGMAAAMHFTCACRMCTEKDPAMPVKYKGGHDLHRRWK